MAIVISAAIMLKIPRFFHFRIINENGIWTYGTTRLMEDPSYIWFTAYWDDLFITGLLPFSILIYLNARIYLKVLYCNASFNRILNNYLFLLFLWITDCIPLFLIILHKKLRDSRQLDDCRHQGGNTICKKKSVKTTTVGLIELHELGLSNGPRATHVSWLHSVYLLNIVYQLHVISQPSLLFFGKMIYRCREKISLDMKSSKGKDQNQSCLYIKWTKKKYAFNRYKTKWKLILRTQKTQYRKDLLFYSIPVMMALGKRGYLLKKQQ